MKKALVVGAGFAGAVAARELAEAGWKVLVIDKRNHIGGNAWDYVNELGIRVHRYGPHLWHTNNEEVHAWASRFTEWVPYEHTVRALLANGKTVPLPINNETIETVFGERFISWCIDQGIWAGTYDGELKDGAHEAFLETLLPTELGDTLDSRAHVEKSVGKELCELFFAPYTKKMWGLELEELPASVAARIPTSVGSWDNRYFPKDKIQYLPKDGYTEMFRKIFQHPNITVELNKERSELPQYAGEFYERMEDWEDVVFDAVFTSEPIDTYYNCDMGELPWRSVIMHVQSLPIPSVLPTPVMNFTHDGKFTRVTEWKKLPAHGENPHWTTLTFEEPCDYRDNGNERYYPVKTTHKVDPNRELYKKYAERAASDPKLVFMGRCGKYQYLDMWVVIAQTLKTVRTFLENKDAKV